ncbi:restriction endonuclease subunit S [Vibrio furnissii]|uniref:restriction endonuclease subunit S n=1 Tax=Vibrio furnissii TaxID=29494 RepID=UPI003D7E2116
MGKYQAFSEYKYSNNEFLGKVPSHWVMGRFKFCTTRVVVGIAEAATHAYSDFGVPIIRSTNIKEKCLDTTRLLYIKDSFAEQNSSKYLYENDIVTIRTGFPGISAVVPSSLDKSQCFTNLISTPKKSFNPKFLTYFLNSSSGKAYFELLGWGSAQKNISVPILQDFPLAHPLIDEQTQIANFLDHETAKIDTLIEKQQQLIKLLKEKRQAVISHAVTKGLNPQAPMKDSGVEWLGEVPEHWVVCKLKWKTRTTSGGTPTTSKYELYYEDGKIPWIRTTDLNNDVLIDTPIRITSKAVADTACSLLPTDSILLAMYGGAGSIGKHSLLKFVSTINQAVCGILPNENFSSEYLHRFYEFYRPFWMIGAAGTRKDPNIGQDDIKEGKILLPPRNEQFEIAQYIEQMQAQFDLLTVKAERAIELMQERRTALISAAVTGKIDVRNWQAPTSQNQSA